MKQTQWKLQYKLTKFYQQFIINFINLKQMKSVLINSSMCPPHCHYWDFGDTACSMALLMKSFQLSQWQVLLLSLEDVQFQIMSYDVPLCFSISLRLLPALHIKSLLSAAMLSLSLTIDHYNTDHCSFLLLRHKCAYAASMAHYSIAPFATYDMPQHLTTCWSITVCITVTKS